ncbi:Stk1 family PASTA domain-containing Ser/Thr kinase [Olsenella uli]|uniref:Stk1 family PASTA domain-containing Ser/Thr kinase n=1 Tax=Olsenella uli TaxID=133926 RepID=UPI0012ABB7FC|nr:Stk1 family PASTA domain-containing Ser/Thr kinase [Olsenella uli]
MADRVLGGRYTVQDKIGIGGMATVYRGLDNVLGRTVAIKTMLPQYAADPSFAARFKQEAQAAAGLQSPYIVGVYDWGRDQDTYYIIMEYLRGTDLKSGIRKHGALDCRKVAQIGSQICQALSVAHKHDIIHRDIKPQNIMVQPDGNIKVMDFGIARAKNSHLTADNSVLGTAHYVSPEQTQGKELGPTSDLYSLGIVMYEAATGKVPFDGDDAISVALKQVQEQPVPPSQINPNVDATLEGIILKCMQKNPADRFQTADELRRVLNDYLAGRIVNLGEATSLISAAPTNVMNRNGRTQSMNRTTATPMQTGRIPVASGPQHGLTDMPEKKPVSKGKVAGIVIGAITVIALIAFAITSLMADPEQQAIPNLAGMTETQARAAIAKYNNYFEVGNVTQDYSDTVEEGKLISQDPDQGEMKGKGTKINLVFSKGKQPAAEVTVPNLSGKSPSEANAELEKVGLKGTAGDSVESDSVESGKVASQDPVAGSTAKEGDTITYHISKGKGKADAGDHSGEGANSAKSALESAGFSVDIEYDYSSDTAKGYVISQSPTGEQEKGATITLTVSQGAKPAVTTSAATSSPTTGNSSHNATTGNTGSSNNSNSGSENTGNTGGPSKPTTPGSGSEDLADGQ